MSKQQRRPGWRESVEVEDGREHFYLGGHEVSLETLARTLYPKTYGTMSDEEITAQIYERHTIDISDPAPKYVEDELVAFEKGWQRAKYASLLLLGFVLGLGFGYWVLPQWVHHG